MIKEIEDFDGLEALRLEGNTVGVEAAKVIAKALEKKSELKVRSSGQAGSDWLGTSFRSHHHSPYLCPDPLGPLPCWWSP